MWLGLILTAVAVVLLVFNRNRIAPRSPEEFAQIAWQADLHYQKALERMQENIEQDRDAIKKAKVGTVSLRAHLKALEDYIAWMEQVKASYTALSEASRYNADRQLQLLTDWKSFTDAVWAQANNDRWQETYLEHGLDMDERLYENAKAYSQKAQEVADHILAQAAHAH